jgi:chromosome segregation ATPase
LAPGIIIVADDHPLFRDALRQAIETLDEKYEVRMAGDFEAVEAQVAALRRQREALGAVNLRAEEDAREVQDEHDRLIREKTDLEDAIRALRTGIAI